MIFLQLLGRQLADIAGSTFWRDRRIQLQELVHDVGFSRARDTAFRRHAEARDIFARQFDSLAAPSTPSAAWRRPR